MDDWNDISYNRARYKTHVSIIQDDLRLLFMPSGNNGAYLIFIELIIQIRQPGKYLL